MHGRWEAGAVEAATGAVLGALVGDAAGAVLELREGAIGAADVERAMSLPGGGVWRVAPGQVTDDGELTMSLLGALARSSASSPPRDEAANAYARWAASKPFDIGATTKRSLGCLAYPGRRFVDLANVGQLPAGRARRRAGAPATDPPIADLMTEAASELCMESKANGSLMRATPLGVWAASRDDAAAAEAAAADARLSHPNPACVDATCAYVIAIASLVRAPSDAARAIEAASAFVRAKACDEVRSWLDEALAGVVVPYEPQVGFVRIAFTHAFRHLALGTSYVDALRETLAGGGDTDTNACIVGGLVGARAGARAIPAPMSEAVLACDTGEGAHRRPDELHPRAAPALVRALLEENANGLNSAPDR